MSGLSRGCRTCCQKQQNKIQPANKKASANFSGAKIRGAHFPAGGIFQAASLFPGWSASISHLHSVPFTFSSRSVQPVNRQMLFCSFCFPDAKTRGAYFSASKTIASGLTGQHLPLSILFSYQSHNLQQDNSFLSGASRPTPSCPTSLQSPTPPPPTTSTFLPAPAGQHLPPPFFPYRPHNLQ